MREEDTDVTKIIFLYLLALHLPFKIGAAGRGRGTGPRDGAAGRGRGTGPRDGVAGRGHGTRLRQEVGVTTIITSNLERLQY